MLNPVERNDTCNKMFCFQYYLTISCFGGSDKISIIMDNYIIISENFRNTRALSTHISQKVRRLKKL